MHSCFNTADQFVATITTATSTAYTYDTSENQTSDGQDVYTWDSADRLVGVTAPTATVAYIRDPLDRLVLRTKAATTSTWAHCRTWICPKHVLDGIQRRVDEQMLDLASDDLRAP
jgi:YD repeat-containing protein